MTAVTLLAPAKVNLCLEMLGRRPDGYHEVRTVLQAIALADVLRFEPAGEVSLQIAPPDAVEAEGNLIMKAAELLRDEAGTHLGARIRLEKRIPVSAGLGGGSSDAAATLLGLLRLWGLDMDKRRLLELAAKLGSDVPFFIEGGTALGEGRGEQLTPLPTPGVMWAVVLSHPEEVADGKTEWLYSLLTPSHYSAGGARTEEVARRLRLSEPLAAALFNVFDGVAPAAYERTASGHRAMAEAGATDVHLAGSGPALFTVTGGEAEARRMQERLAGQGNQAYAAAFLPKWGIEGSIGP